MPRTLPLSDAGWTFVADRHLATLSTLGPGGLIHVAAVGFTVHEGLVRVTTSDGSQKVRNIERDGRATVGQVAGPQWLSIAGHARISRDPEEIELAVQLYTRRYRPPSANPRRVVVVLEPEKVLGSADLLLRPADQV